MAYQYQEYPKYLAAFGRVVANAQDEAALLASVAPVPTQTVPVPDHHHQPKPARRRGVKE